MQGSHLVKKSGLNQLHTGLEKLCSDTHGKESTKQEHAKRKPQLHRTDVFVVSGKQPARNALSRSVMMCAHRLSPLTLLHAGDITRLDNIARVVTKCVALVG